MLVGAGSASKQQPRKRLAATCIRGGTPADSLVVVARSITTIRMAGSSNTCFAADSQSLTMHASMRRKEISSG